MKYFALLAISLTLFSAGLSAQNATFNTTLRDQIDFEPRTNDIWGYVAPDSTEYALVGLQDAVSIVSLADPDNIVEIQRIEGTPTVWRDLKTMGDYAFVVADGNVQDGLLVIDLSPLPDSVSFEFINLEHPTSGDSLTSAHNIYVDTKEGYAYIAGSNLNFGGQVIYDVSNPAQGVPFVADAPSVYAHDVYVQNDRMYASEIYVGTLTIYDVSDPQNIVFLGSAPTPSDFTHNAWTTADANYIFTCDERPDAPVAAYDISNENEPILIDEFRPERSLGQGTIPHNVHVIDEYLVTSYYTDGLEIADASVPDNIIEVGYFDTWAPTDELGFNGNWGAYPFLPSGLVLMTDRDSGLYVVEVDYIRGARLHGNITDADSGASLNGVSVVLTGPDDKATTTDATGDYKTGSAFGGAYTATFSLDGYDDLTVPVELENDVVTIVDTSLQLTAVNTEYIAKASVVVNVFPNPSDDFFQIDYDLPGRNFSTLSVKVTDQAGRTVAERRLESFAVSGRVQVGQQLPEGHYSIQLLSGDELLYTTKVVKQ
ncbi:hypothetical protein CEQ90_10155 [Lewinellaceae bacterium SD302]|nr:hypothetical protein CEQ90_10155 [Lewinellaceae bacterium SD302]